MAEVYTIRQPVYHDFSTTNLPGVRPSLFFNTSGKPGGYVDFDNYTVLEPRARGLEREIPTGRTIVLTSGADGTFLAADPESDSGCDSCGQCSDHARFQVIDLGTGRMMLRTVHNQVISVSDDGVVLRNLDNAKPGNSETFQWINLMHGDIMLMSLDHLYRQRHFFRSVTDSATGPNQPGAITYFKWKKSVKSKRQSEFLYFQYTCLKGYQSDRALLTKHQFSYRISRVNNRFIVCM